jgi:hypothetical protein
MADVVELQFQILEWVYSSQQNGYGIPARLPDVANKFSASWEDVIAAMDLLTRRNQIDVARCVPTRGALLGWERFRADSHDIREFLDGLGCHLFQTSVGRERLALLRRQREAAALPNLGEPTANEIVRAGVENLLQGLATNAERRRVLGRVLAQLVSIGVHNYRDAEFLAKRALEALDGRAGRADIERSFYQPFLYRELARDDVLAPHLTKNPEQASGLCDLLCMGDVAIEAKVVYPDDTAEHAASVGIAQATQYAARSGIAFLVVLDMRRRSAAAHLGQIANDVRIISVGKQDGPTPVRIARVLHVVGHGPPSRARL